MNAFFQWRCVFSVIYMLRLLDYCKDYINMLFLVIFHSPETHKYLIKSSDSERFERTGMIWLVRYKILEWFRLDGTLKVI